MKRWFILTGFLMAVLLFGTGNLPKGTPQFQVPGFQPLGKKAEVVPGFGKIPLYFIANQGQVDNQARFYARTSRYNLWVTAEGLIFDSVKKDKVEKRTEGKNPGFAPSAQQRDVSRFIFLNANRCPGIVPEKPSAYRVNYLQGNDKSRWLTHIPTSERVWYKNLYKNIDLKVYGVEKEIEYDWIVKPTGNPQDIRFAYENIEKSFIDAAGNLAIRSSLGEWVHKKPMAYQVIDGKREAVEVAFTKAGNSRHTYGFKVALYNRDYELIIDPLVLTYSTYLGGSDDDEIRAIAVDGNGSIIVAGTTRSADFPTMNPLSPKTALYYDGFITKFTADGSGLVFSTFLGGSAGCEISSIAVDSSGNIYAGGDTTSSDFPVVNAFQSVLHSGSDGFITKLSSSGSSLIYSTFLGGNGSDAVNHIAVNSSGEIYATGYTYSLDFPLQNPIQSAPTEVTSNVFVTKLSASGSSLVYSTYLVGSDSDIGKALAIDDTGAAYVVGQTHSIDFPVVNAYQSSNVYNADTGFITKISPTGTSMVFSTYFGGNIYNIINDVDVNSTGVYVTGSTASTNFPTTPNAYQRERTSGMMYEGNGFIAKFSLSGEIVYSTLYGGLISSGTVELTGICADTDGSVYVTGTSSGAEIPQIDGLEPNSGNSDAFVSRLAPDGTHLTFSSTIPIVNSYSTMSGKCIAMDSEENIYLAGSSDNYLYTLYPFQGVYGGGYTDAFIIKLEDNHLKTLTVIAPNGGESWDGNTSHPIYWTSGDGINNVKIEYSTDNGTSWNTIIASTTNTGSYNWTVPNSNSTTCLVKISDTESDTTDQGDTVFSIVPPRSITVTSPNGGEIWDYASTQTITWTNTGTIDNVRIKYSIDNGASWETIIDSTPNTGSYEWTVFELYYPYIDTLVQVSDVEGDASDRNDNAFTISRPRTITVTNPTEPGTGYEGNTEGGIAWEYTGAIFNVKLEYSIDDGSSWSTITDSAPCNGAYGYGHYTWIVPNTPSTTCLVRISDTTGPASDLSDNVFTIIAQRTITVTSPNGGESWERTTAQNITWTTTGSVDSVKLEYSTDNGSTWTTIIDATTNSGTYNWTVPNTPSTTCLVRITDIDVIATDTSDAVFTISAQKTITVTAPNSGETWEGTTAHNITWTSTGTIANVKLEYSTNNGSSWTTIIDSTTNSGTYN